MLLLDALYDQGNTIILVTHESHVAEHAHRVIHILDGRIDSDELTANGRAAA
jgi:putative ABC transport system ATP-binding protein